MKKKLLIILVLLLFLVGCGNKIKKIEEAAAKEVKTELKNIEKINTKEIDSIIDYIDKNIDTIKRNSDNYKTFYKNVLIINTICSKDSSLKDNNVCKLGSLTSDYLKKQNKKDLTKIKDLIKEIKKSNDVSNFINLYYTKVMSNDNLAEIVEKVSLESRTEGFITEEKIDKALLFIFTNYNKPFANSEVLDKTLYYTEYLNKVGSMKKNNEIIELSKLVRQYVNDQDENTKKEIEAKIKYVKEHKDRLIKELVK